MENSEQTDSDGSHPIKYSNENEVSNLGKQNRNPKLKKSNPSSSKVNVAVVKKAPTGAIKKDLVIDLVDINTTCDFKGGWTPYKQVARNVAGKQKLGRIKAKRKMQISKKDSENMKKNCSAKCEVPSEEIPDPSHNVAASGFPKDRSQEIVIANLADEAGDDGKLCVLPTKLCMTCGQELSEKVYASHYLLCLRSKYQRPGRSENQKDMNARDKASSSSYVMCQICQEDISELNMTSQQEHINACIDASNSSKPVPNQISVLKKNVQLHDNLESCHFCNENLQHLNSARRTQHINRCIDMEERRKEDERKAAETLEKARNKVLDCPVCGQALKSHRTRQIHMKRCAVKYEVSVSVLKERMREQEQEYKARLDAGIIPPELQTSSRGGRNIPRRGTNRQRHTVRERRLEEPGSKMDEETQLALALSESLREEVQQRNNPSVSQASDPTPSSFDSKRTNAFSILMTPKQKANAPSRRGKKKALSSSIPRLLSETQEQRERSLEQKVESLLIVSSQEGEFDSTPKFIASKLLTSSLSDDKGKALWRVDSCVPGETLSPFYVDKLVPHVVKTDIRAGSKIKRMSVIPGWEPQAGETSVLQSRGSANDEKDYTMNPSMLASTQTAVLLAQIADESNTTIRLDNTISHQSLVNQTVFTLSSPVHVARPNKTVHFYDLEDESPKRSDPVGFCDSKQINSIKTTAVDKLIQDLAKLVKLNNGDIAIKCKNNEHLSAHSVFLGLRCPLLLQTAGQRKMLDFPKFNKKSVEVLLHYIYAGCLDVPADVLAEVRHLAERYKLPDLLAACEDVETIDSNQSCDRDPQHSVTDGKSTNAPSHALIDKTLQNLLHDVWGSDEEEDSGSSHSDGEDSIEQQQEQEEMDKLYDFMASQRKQSNQDTDCSSESNDEAFQGDEESKKYSSDHNMLGKTLMERLEESFKMDVNDSNSSSADLSDHSTNSDDENECHVVKYSDSCDQIRGISQMKNEISTPQFKSDDTNIGDHVDYEDGTKSCVHIPNGVSKINIPGSMHTPLASGDSIFKTNDATTTPDLFACSPASSSMEISAGQAEESDIELGEESAFNTAQTLVASEDEDLFDSFNEPADTCNYITQENLESSSPPGDTKFSYSRRSFSSDEDLLENMNNDSLLQQPCIEVGGDGLTTDTHSRQNDNDENDCPFDKESIEDCEDHKLSSADTHREHVEQEQNNSLPDAEKSPTCKSVINSSVRSKKRKRTQGSQSISSLYGSPFIRKSKRPRDNSDPELASLEHSELSNEGDPQQGESSPVFNISRSSLRERNQNKSLVDSPNRSSRKLIDLTIADDDDENKNTLSGKHSFLGLEEVPHDPGCHVGAVYNSSDPYIVQLDGSPEKMATNSQAVEDIPAHRNNLTLAIEKIDEEEEKNDPSSSKKNSVCEMPDVWDDFDDMGGYETMQMPHNSNPKQTELQDKDQDNPASQTSCDLIKPQDNPPIGHLVSSKLFDPSLDSGSNELAPHDTVSTPAKDSPVASKIKAQFKTPNSCKSSATFKTPVSTSRIKAATPYSDNAGSPYMYDPPTDMETDVSMALHDSDDLKIWSLDNEPVAASNQGKESGSRTKSTRPVAKKIKPKKKWVPPSPYTPMPIYDNMDTPNLKRACQNVGVRALPKKRMIVLLKDVFQKTHAYETDSECEVSPAKPSLEPTNANDACPTATHSSGKPKSKPATKKGCSTAKSKISSNMNIGTKKLKPSKSKSSKQSKKSTACPQSSEDSDLNSSQDMNSSGCSQESEACGQDIPEESMMFDPEEKGPKLSKKDVTYKRQQVWDYIKGNSEIYMQILHYEPIDFASFHQQLKDSGKNMGQGVVMDFLDDQNIQFTMKNQQASRWKSKKSRKKVSSSQSQRN